jgi:hypothetical protein
VSYCIWLRRSGDGPHGVREWGLIAAGLLWSIAPVTTGLLSYEMLSMDGGEVPRWNFARAGDARDPIAESYGNGCAGSSGVFCSGELPAQGVWLAAQVAEKPPRPDF